MHGMERKWASAGTLLAAAMGLAACASTGSSSSGGFPDPASATLAGGTYPNLDNVRAVVPGMSKDQLYHLLGRPHFHEGVFGVREWNYLFHLPGPDSQTSACQFKVSFDDAERTSAMAWSPQSCAALLAKQPPQREIVEERKVALSADALFAFASAELSAAGRESLDRIAAEAGDGVEQVRVVGHTDRIGNESANDALSRRRADAVAAYLIGKGLPASAVVSEGRGEREPAAECTDAPRAQLIACLAPNRRVEVSLRATARK